MSEGPLVVVCTSRPERFEPLGTLFGRQGMALRPVSGPDRMEELLGSGSVHLLLVDAEDPELRLTSMLDAITGHARRRFVPVLVVGAGAEAERVRDRLSGHLAVRVVDLGSAGQEATRQHRDRTPPIRRHLRVPTRLAVHLRDEDGGETTARTHDLSEEGLGLVATTDVAEQTPLTATFTLPGDPTVIALPAEVRRRVPLAGGGFFLGLWFHEVTAETRDRLRDFVQRESAMSAAAP